MEKVPLPIKTKIAAWIYILVIGPITSLSGLLGIQMALVLWSSARSSALIMGTLLLLLGLLVIIFNFLLLTKRKKLYWWLTLITHFPYLVIGIFLILLGAEEGFEEFGFLILFFTIPIALIFILLLLDRKNFWKIAI